MKSHELALNVPPLFIQYSEIVLINVQVNIYVSGIKLSNFNTSKKLSLLNKALPNQLNFRHSGTELPNEGILAFRCQIYHEVLLLEYHYRQPLSSSKNRRIDLHRDLMFCLVSSQFCSISMDYIKGVGSSTWVVLGKLG